jgi:hypothetical protein
MRVDLNYRCRVGANPDESSANGHGPLTNRIAFDDTYDLATLAADALNGSIPFIVNPDRSLSGDC